jgi:hypothetical protein
MQGKRWVAAAAVAVTGWAAPAASAETVFGITEGGALVTFDSATPATITSEREISGLPGTDQIVAIDVRPATLQLYGLSSGDRLYRIDLASGQATAVSAALPVTGSSAGMDFDPANDDLRIVSDADDNVRVDPVEGTVLGTDPDLSFGDGNPTITGIAYTDNAPTSAGNLSPQLFGIDTGIDAVVEHAPPNAGTLTVKGQLGVDLEGDVGFDISTISTSGTGEAGADTAYVVGRPTSDGKAHLFTVNTTSGESVDVGQFPSADPVRDIAVAPSVPSFTVLVDNLVGQRLATVRADSPGETEAGPPITGLGLGEELVAIDQRPNGAGLFGVSTSSRVYQIDPAMGQATPVGAAFTPAVQGDAFGLDFNPVADRMRLVSGANQNLRLNPADGTATEDKDVVYGAGDANAGQDPQVTAVAYTNSVFPAPGATVLYDIDVAQDVLARQDPNEGTLSTVGELGVNAGTRTGFDIVPRFNHGFAALVVGGETRLYAIDAAGTKPAAVLVGELDLPAGGSLRGLALLNESAPIPTPNPTPTPTPTVTPTVTPTPGPKVRPGLTARVAPERDRERPFRFTVKGRVKPPKSVDRDAACKGRVRITARRKGDRFARVFAPVGGDCRFSRKVTLRGTGNRGKARFAIRFAGNAVLKPKTVAQTVRFGG